MRRNIILISLLLLLVACMGAEKLARDVNGTPIQWPRYMTALRDTIPAQASTVYDSLAVPTDAVELVVTFSHAAGYIYTGAAKTLIATSTDWIYVPKETPVALPVMVGHTYIKYRSYTGANSINFIWKRM